MSRHYRSLIILILGISLIVTQCLAESLENERDSYRQVEVFYENVIGQTVIDEFFYSDVSFETSPNMVNPCLAIASSYLAAAAYQDAYISSVLEDLGFDVLYTYYPKKDATSDDLIAYSIGKKVIRVSGAEFNLYVVCIRGTTKNYEWVLNFDIGENSTEHKGFASARDRILTSLNDIVTTPNSQNIVWMMGHSRGAAVANLLADSLCTNENLVRRDAVYCYTYATPKVSKSPSNWGCVHNYVNHADFVTRLPLSKWGFFRHGIDIGLKNSGNIESKMKDYFTSMNNEGYLGFPKWQTDIIISTLESYAPSIKSYYGTRFDLGGWHSPSSLFMDGIAPLLMGRVDSLSAQVIWDEYKSSFLVRTMLREFIGSEILSVIKGLTSSDQPLDITLYPFAHAHSKESYIGYMKALYDEQLLQLISTSRIIGKNETDNYDSLATLRDTDSLTDTPTTPPSDPESCVITPQIFEDYYNRGVKAYNSMYRTDLQHMQVMVTEGKDEPNNLPIVEIHSEDGKIDFYLDYRIDECIIYTSFDSSEVSSILQEPSFLQCYVIASCFADGRTPEERIENLMNGLDFENTYQQMRIVYTDYGGRFENYPIYRGTKYIVEYWPDAGNCKFLIFQRDD